MNDTQTDHRSGNPASQVGEDAAKARAELERETESARERLTEARRMAEDRARSFVGDATEQARSFADQQKETAAQSLRDFAEAVHRASDELGQRDQTLAARFVQEAAGGLESLSRSVGAQSVEGVLDTVRDFGRSNPTAFIAGSVLAGMAIGRFARASHERDYRRYEHYFAGSGAAGQGRQPQPRPQAAGAAAARPQPDEHRQGR